MTLGTLPKPSCEMTPTREPVCSTRPVGVSVDAILPAERAPNRSKCFTIACVAGAALFSIFMVRFMTTLNNSEPETTCQNSEPETPCQCSPLIYPTFNDSWSVECDKEPYYYFTGCTSGKNCYGPWGNQIVQSNYLLEGYIMSSFFNNYSVSSYCDANGACSNAYWLRYDTSYDDYRCEYNGVNVFLREAERYIMVVTLYEFRVKPQFSALNIFLCKVGFQPHKPLYCEQQSDKILHRNDEFGRQVSIKCPVMWSYFWVSPIAKTVAYKCEAEERAILAAVDVRPFISDTFLCSFYSNNDWHSVQRGCELSPDSLSLSRNDEFGVQTTISCNVAWKKVYLPSSPGQFVNGTYAYTCENMTSVA